ncbi:hypothetical protein ACFWQC_01760 [Nocardioides sp. NPDC058538]|uniref:hypothetical protein n=1 Tax=Nocardioides sp. NPDC058538 TaxID=3346542 RepID=UPI003652555F
MSWAQEHKATIVVAIITAVGAIAVATVTGVFGLISRSSGGTPEDDPVSPPTSGSASPAVSPSATPSTGGPSSTPSASTPIFTVFMASSSTVEKDTALACDRPKSCVGLNVSVSGPDGPFGLDCNLRWNLVAAPDYSTVLEQDRKEGCNGRWIYPGFTRPLGPGDYRVQLTADLDSGEHYEGEYDFTLVRE